MDILTAVASAHQHVLSDPKPFARLEEFADSSVNYSVFFWTSEVFIVEQIKSEIRIDLFNKIREQG